MNSPLFKLIFVAYGLDKHVKMYLGEYIKRFLTKINWTFNLIYFEIFGS